MISYSKIEKELNWFYHQAHSAIGISSSYCSIISAIMGTSSSGLNTIEDQVIGIISQPKSPIKKLRKIERTLRSMPSRERRIIDSIYAGYNYPPQIVSIFGQWAGPTLFNSKITNLKELLILSRKKLAKVKLTDIEKNNLIQIEREAKELFNHAHNIYLIERNKNDI